LGSRQDAQEACHVFIAEKTREKGRMDGACKRRKRRMKKNGEA
jgi:hypothetical protein